MIIESLQNGESRLHLLLHVALFTEFPPVLKQDRRMYGLQIFHAEAASLKFLSSRSMGHRHGLGIDHMQEVDWRADAD